MGTAVGSALGTIFDGPDRSAPAAYLCHRTSPPKLAHGRWHQAHLGQRGPRQQPEGGRRQRGSAGHGRSADPRLAPTDFAGSARTCTSARSGEGRGPRPPILVSSTQQRRPGSRAGPARPCPTTWKGKCPGQSERHCSPPRARRALVRPEARRRGSTIGEAKRACNRIWDQAADSRWARRETQPRSHSLPLRCTGFACC